MTIFVPTVFSFEMAPVGLEPHTPGPNCWNGAMKSLGLVHNYRFMHPDEYMYLLNSYCEEIETPVYGSMGRMYDDWEVHAYIWIDESTLYAKHSNQSFEPYEIMNFDRILKNYFTNRNCALMQNKPIGCFRKTNFYTCEVRQDHTQEQILRLAQIESLVFDLVFSSETKLKFADTCHSSSYLKRTELLVEINNQLEVLKNQYHPDLEYLKLWALSLKEQIYMSEVNSRIYRCPELSYEDKYIYYRNINLSLNQIMDQIN